MRVFFLLLLLLPVAELWFIIEVGDAIGAIPAIGLLIAAGILGLALLRLQSFSTMSRLQSRLAQGEVPSQELVEGFLLAFAGILFLCPGFLTDIVALMIIVPPIRKLLARWLLSAGRIKALHIGGAGFSPYRFHGRPGERRGEFYEGEFTRESDPLKPLPRSDSEPDGK